MQILVVDDESCIRDLVTQSLEPLGYEIASAENGLEALRLAEQINHGIMILDVTMPGLDGYGVLTRIRSMEKAPHIFVIMLTARADLEDLERGLLTGADDYVAKPFQVRELVARVRAAERVQSLQKELLLKNRQLTDANDALTAGLNEQERLNRKMMLEMEVAARLQDSLLSAGRLELGNLRVQAHYRPSTKLGGDFYDLRKLGDRHAGIFLADAVGHGVSAALLAAMLKMALEDALMKTTVPAKILESINRSFLFCADHGKYLTAFFGLLDCRTGDMAYSMAGHVPPLLYRSSDRTVEKLDAPGLCLGIFAEGGYQDRQVLIRPGDRLVAYTDGIYEASHDEVQLFGSRLPGFLQESAALDNEEFLARLDGTLTEFLAGNPPGDDYTLLLIQLHEEPDPVTSP